MKTKQISKIVISSLLLVVLAITTVMPVLAAERKGTITIDNATKGATYEIYRLFDATTDANDGTKISYKLPSGKQLDATGQTYFNVDSAGNVTAKDTLNASVLDSDAFKQWALGFAIKEGNSIKADGTSVVFNQVPFGYYLLKRNTDNSVISVDSTTPNVTIKDKNDSSPSIDPNDPTSGKTIVTGEADTARDIKATYAIGDKVPFQIKFTATNFVTENRVTKAVTEYKIVDTPTNLKILKDTLSIKVGNRTLEASKYDVNVAEDTGKMTITIPWIDRTETADPSDGNKINGTPLYDPTETVIITYQSLVMAGAADGQASNKADISYKVKADPTDPTPPTEPEKPVAPKPIDPLLPDPNKPTIYTYKITVNKKDGTTQAPLTGAKFRLYSAATDGTEIKLVKNTDGSYRVAEKNADGAWWENGKAYADVVEVEAGTNIVIKGLKGQETYYLEETTAPDGYNKLTERKPVKTEKEIENQLKASDVTVDVLNNAGVELPSTGGIGRTIFYGLGILLIGTVVVAMISKMRMQSINK